MHFEAILDEVNGDAEELLKRVRDNAVKRFGSTKCGTLEEYLEEEGFIDLNNSLPESEIIGSAKRDCKNQIKSGILSNADICSTLDRIKKIQI